MIDLKLDKLSGYETYLKAREMGLVEDGIIPVCDALAEVGAKPLSSCEGHLKTTIDTSVRLRLLRKLFKYDDVFWSKPFVMFTASMELAGTVNQIVEAFPVNAANVPILQKELYFVWMVTGSFDNQNRLRWTLTTNDSRLEFGSKWIHINVQKSLELVKRDLRKIGDLITTIEVEPMFDA